MADGAFRYQQMGAGPFYPQHHPRNHNRTTSPHGPRRPFNTDTPSPSRSPVNAVASHNYSMYGHNGYQNQHGMMNGGQNHQRFGNMHMAKHQQNQYGHHNQSGQHHNQGHHGGHMGHQHNISAGTFPSGSSALSFNQDSVQNGGSDMTHEEMEEENNEHIQEQLQQCKASRDMNGPNQRARQAAHLAKGVNYVPTGSAADELLTDGRGRGPTVVNSVPPNQTWDELDLGGQGLHALSPVLFQAYRFIRRLDLNHNSLTYLPPFIGELRQLVHLDLSKNLLTELPPEIGMLSKLRRLDLFDNHISSLCYEIGFLYRLEFLGLWGNPLEDGQKEKIAEGGTKALIHYMRESMPEPKEPNEREWHQLEESVDENADTVRTLSYNILCDRYATASHYGYVPDRVLSWAFRKGLILNEVREQNADIVCFQELDRSSYDEFFRGKLAESGYKGYYAQKSRAETLGDMAKFVDGCGTFWKDKKYILLATEHLVLGRKAVERPGAKASADMLNRVWQRDDIATVVFLENRITGSRIIVANTHLYWDPVYKDVKLIQAAVMLEELSKLAEKYRKHPAVTNKQVFRFADADGDGETPLTEPGPSLEYTNPNQIPMVICGDFNAAAGTAVYDLITKKGMNADHADFAGRDYGSFSRAGMAHDFTMKSSYGPIEDDMPFTNYTPDFVDVLDYIWYSANSLRVTGLLGKVDPDYLKKVPGFPNFHFPADHLALVAEFKVEKRRNTQKVEADFGPPSRR